VRQARNRADLQTSFDKANRTSARSNAASARCGAAIFADCVQRWRSSADRPVTSASSARFVAEAVDVLQIPAFLCRQTGPSARRRRDGQPVNVKKRASLAPRDMARWCQARCGRQPNTSSPSVA